MKFNRYPPSVISYRDYKSYSPYLFRAELNCILSFDLNFINNDTFTQIVMELLNKHCPIKFKYIRGNDSPFMTKELHKAIMQRSKLRNRLNKLNTIEASDNYRKQRNHCTSLLRKTKKSYFKNLNPADISDNKKFYFKNLNPSDISDNKKFWKIVKPWFSEKRAHTSSKIKLLENGVVHDDDATVAQDVGKYFSSIVENLNIPTSLGIENITLTSDSDPVSNVISKYNNHPSILKIRQHVGCHILFPFSHVSTDTVHQEIFRLMKSKATPISSIPPSIIKEHCDIFAKKIHIDFNASITDGIFPNNLKYADVSPIFKTGDTLLKSNCRPNSILPALSKIFELLYCNQIEEYIEPFLSIFQCGFRKHFSAQNCILLLIEKWKKCLDEKGACGVLLTYLSKAFDCLRLDLLIAK